MGFIRRGREPVWQLRVQPARQGLSSRGAAALPVPSQRLAAPALLFLISACLAQQLCLTDYIRQHTEEVNT